MNKEVVNPEFVHLPNQDTDFSFADLKQIIFRRWKPALAIGAAVFTGIFVPTMLKTPQYQSETLILLENPKTQDAAPVAPTDRGIVGGIASLKNLSTEIVVLKSKDLISQAVAKYPSAFEGLSVSEIAHTLSIYTKVVNDIPTDVLTVSFRDSSPQRTKEVLDALGKIYVEYSLEKQRSQAANAIAFIDEQLPNAQLELDKVSYEIRRFRQENNLVDPNIYASGVSEFRQSLERDSKSAYIALESAKRKYSEIATQLETFGQNPDTILVSTILSQDGVYNNLAAQLGNLDTQYFLNSTSFKDTLPMMQDLKDKRKEAQILLRQRAKKVLGETVSQEVLDQAIINSQENIANYNNTANETSDANAQGGIVTNLGNQLLAAKNEIAILQSQITGTDNAQNTVERDFQNVPQLQETYAELERQLSIKSEAVNYLLQRRQELQIALAQETAPWKVLDQPYLPTKPISPNIQRGLAMALSGASVAGILAAWLLHKLDSRIKLIEEVKQITHLPLIGAVPKVLEPKIVLSHETEPSNTKGYSYRYSSFTESFRAIAMNLSYLMAKSGKIKSLVLTSSTSSEGKSTTTYNLGLALTDLGSRVLIVDADMRKPRIHKLTKLGNEKGLSEAIISDEPWTETVNSNVVENLDIITAGSSVPNPIAILRSSKMSQLIKEWEAAYDYVLIDTPPIGIMADAQSIIYDVDTVLFVVGIDRATEKSLSHTLETLQHKNVNLAGFVANFVEKDLDYYSYSYYSHYYNQPINSTNSDGEQNKGIMQQFRRR